MINYVLGFCFLNNGDCVLIEKTTEDWQNGLVNGIGGKMKDWESPIDAMVREFEEETEIKTTGRNWRHAVTLQTKDWRLHVYRGKIQRKYDKHLTYNSEGMLIYTKSMPDNMEKTARWLFWLCRDESTFGLLSSPNFNARRRIRSNIETPQSSPHHPPPPIDLHIP